MDNMVARSVRSENEPPPSSQELRSPGSTSDIMSVSGRSSAGPLPATSPRPAYIAQGAAENLAASEVERPVSISEPALELVNSFLDQTLYNLLNLSKSTSLPALKLAVPKLLKPRLGQAAIHVAEEDLREMNDGEEADETPAHDHPLNPTDFDLELAWKLARLRCMAYARLGDMEDEDAEEYLEQDHLEEYAHNSSISTNSNSTLFITSVLEFLGEQALCTAAQNAERRHNLTFSKKASEVPVDEADHADLMIETSDMMQLGREGPLSRLWRSWRRDTRVMEPFASRSNTPAVMTSPNMADLGHSRNSSLVSPEQAIPEVDTPRALPSPSQIPLPIRDRDVDEIEIPGLAPELDDEQTNSIITVPVKSRRRPVSMIVLPNGSSAWSPPASPQAPAFQERSPLRPHWYRSRSSSLPPAPQFSANSPVDVITPDRTNMAATELEGNPNDTTVERESQTTPTPNTHENARAGIISGAVGAIAGALGVEALRSHKNKDQRDQKDPSLNDSELVRQPKRTAAEEFMGPSNNLSAPSDARTSASISNVGDFDSMHIPMVESDENLPEVVQREREASDPEDLALSSADEENVTRATERTPRDPTVGVASIPRERGVQDVSLPSSPSSPKRMKREAAVFENNMIPMRQEEEFEPQQSQVRRSVVSDTYATAPTSQRYSGSHYSQADRDSASLPIQRPVSGEQQNAWPAVVPTRGSSLEKSRPNHSHSASKSSEYSHDSQRSTGNSKLQGPQRDQDPRTLSQQRAIFKDGSDLPKPGHSRDTSRAKDKAAVGAGILAATGVAGGSAARRQHLRLWSDSQEKIAVDEDKKKSLEILINSDETLHYTLTPEQARLREDPTRSSSMARTQTQELADFIRNTGPPDEEQHIPHNVPMNALRSNPPALLQSSIEHSGADMVAAQAPSKSRNPLGAPRDARPERNTTRDLADYVRSTGPQTSEQLPQVLGTRPGTGRSAATAGGLRHDGVPMAPPVGAPSIDIERPTTASNKPASRLKFQARDARPARDRETSDLIDFIREGPPRKAGEHRIDRHVAPFRTTMDSDDLNALAPPADLNGRSSVGSTHESSVMTGRSVQESTNSRTGLLENHKPAPRVNGANSASSGIVRQAIPEMDGMPPRKRRGPRDPYSIDFSDDDEELLEEEVARPPPRQEESLIDFLRNTAPPPGMAPLPIVSGARSDGKPDIKHSISQSKLRDVLLRQNSSASRSNGTVRPSTNGTVRARESSPHLTQVGSKLDKYRPTQSTHAAHVERNRQKPRVEPREATNVRTGTSDLADYFKNTAPPEAVGPSNGHEKYVSSNVKEQAGFLKFFSKQRGSVRR